MNRVRVVGPPCRMWDQRAEPKNFVRTKLSDLRGSLQGNDKLEELLLEAVNNSEKMDKLKSELDKSEGGDK